MSIEISNDQTNTPINLAKSWLKKESVSSFLAGALAGVIGKSAVYPIERSKILFQLQGAGQNNYHGVFSTISKLYKEEGIRGLFRGNGLNSIRVFPYSAIQFYLFQTVKTAWLEPNQKELSNYQRLIAGGIGGAGSVFATYPLDLIRTRLSVQTANLEKLGKGKIQDGVKPPGFFRILIDVYKNEGGIKSLYRGIWPTSLSVGAYIGINFTVYEQLKELVPEAESSPLLKILFGATASGVGLIITSPMDLLRRRFQVMAMSNNDLGFQYKGVGDALITIYKTEGFKGLYKGLGTNLVRLMPSMAITWVSYEYIKEQMMSL